MHIDKHKLTPPVDQLMPMCVSYGMILCLCEIRIYLFGLFTFAKIPDNSNSFFNHSVLNFFATFFMNAIQAQIDKKLRKLSRPFPKIECYDDGINVAC